MHIGSCQDALTLASTGRETTREHIDWCFPKVHGPRAFPPVRPIVRLQWGKAPLESTQLFGYSEHMKPGADLNTFVRIIRQNLPFLTERYQVESLGVFGSYVRNVQREDSDLDLLVTFRRTPSLLQLVDLENYLSDLLGVKVDLVMKENLKRRIGKRILKEVMPL